MPSPTKHVDVHIDLDQVCRSAQQIRQRTRVPLLAVVKADAYGLGAVAVSQALADIADEFVYFTLEEAREVGRPGIVLGPPDAEPQEYAALQVRPAVSSYDHARRYARVPSALSVDSGMQRFGCQPPDVEPLLRLCQATDLMTHAPNAGAADLLRSLAPQHDLRRHAAATSLLDAPAAWLDAVRPGLALYLGAVRVSTRLAAVRETSGPVGYTGFEAPRVGIVLLGYSNLAAPAVVLVNGRRERLLEVGMNTAFVSLSGPAQVGDEVVLLGDDLSEHEVAKSLAVRPHEVLVRYCSMGPRRYSGAPAGARGEPRSAAVRG